VIPDARFLWLGIAWAVLGVIAAVDRGVVTAWWIAGGLLGFVALVDLLWCRWSSRIEFTRRLPNRFAVGEAGTVSLRIRNEGRRRMEVQWFDGIPEGATTEALPWRGRIPAGKVAEVDYPLVLMERGWAEFPLAHGRLRSPLGLWWWGKTFGSEERIKVYPDYEPVLRFALLAMDARQEQMGIVRRSIAGHSRDFHQLREYREGDPLAQIDWKASSRRMNLISREFQEQRNQTLVFLLDTGRRMRAIDGRLPQFDHCLNALLLLSYIALRQGDQVGVQAFGGADRWLPPVKGGHSMPVLLNHLFDYQTSSEPSDFAAAAERLQMRQRRRSMVVLMTNLRGEDAGDLVPALRILSARHLVVLASLREKSLQEARRNPVADFDAALRFAAAEYYDRERSEVLATLRSHGVITLDVSAEELPVALANRYLEIKAAGRL
jgi:uncharacterized protein (DUF58 family)